MNFEFLKDLRGLGYIYENCNNAEKLAVNMPVQSVFNAGGEGTWEVKNEFAVATWEWTDQGFKVKGCLY